MTNLHHMFAIGLGTQELVIILVIVLLLFGGAKIPALMRGVGRGVGELQEGLKEGRKNFEAGMRGDNDDDSTKTSQSQNN